MPVRQTSHALLGSCMLLLLGPVPAAGNGAVGTPQIAQTEDLQALLRLARERDRDYQTPQLEELRHTFLAGAALLERALSGRALGEIALFKEAHFVLANTEL